MMSLLRMHRLGLLGGLSASLLAAACATTPPESFEQVKADQTLTDNVESALDGDPEFFFRHVDVQAENGKVYLGGYVWSAPAMVRAERIASQVPGVTSVSDQLELERNGSTGGGGAGSR